MADRGWKDEEMLSIALKILDIKPKKEDPGFDRPFLTPYQIAIEFKKSYPETFNALEYKVGGLGINDHTSLAQQFARMLSDCTDKVEKHHLHRCYMNTIIFSDDEHEFQPSNNQDTYLTMFRLIN